MPCLVVVGGIINEKWTYLLELMHLWISRVSVKI